MMSLLHDHDDGHGSHICMWEGPSYQTSAIETNYEALKAENQDNIEEIQRLRTLLKANNINSGKPLRRSTKKSSLRQDTMLRWTRSRSGSAHRSNRERTEPLPHLPNEIILRILRHVVTSTTPIIDPFWKLRPENLTREERAHASISIGLLGTCKAFNLEGTRLLIESNTFVFSQVAALQNFAKLSIELRSKIKHLTLRVVGQYFDDTAYKKVMSGSAPYHSLLQYPAMYVMARPSGTNKDKGIQAYCWQQLVDFLLVLAVSSPAGTKYTKLLPSIQSMRIDLVNFCEHLPFIGSPFIAVLRWHLGPIVDELIITGAPDEEVSNGEERFLPGILKDEGVFASGCAVFISRKCGLKSLPGFGLNLHLVRPTVTTAVKKYTMSNAPKSHIEGGSPPNSIYPEGATVWKYTSDSLSNPEKKWIEFHRRCGYPVSECGELEPFDDADEEIYESEDEIHNEEEDDWDDSDMD